MDNYINYPCVDDLHRTKRDSIFIHVLYGDVKNDQVGYGCSV